MAGQLERERTKGLSGVTGPGRRDRAECQVGNQAESPVLRGESGGGWGKLLTGLRSQVAALRPSGFLAQRPKFNFQGEGCLWKEQL